jgi:hypothetical protein
MDLQNEFERLSEQFGRLWDEFPAILARLYFGDARHSVIDDVPPKEWPTIVDVTFNVVKSLRSTISNQELERASSQLTALMERGDSLLRKVNPGGFLPKETEFLYPGASCQHWAHSLLAAIPEDADVRIVKEPAGSTFNVYYPMYSVARKSESFAECLRGSLRECELDATPDGPVEPNGFRYGDGFCTGLTPMPFRLISALWDSPSGGKWVCGYGPDLAEALWRDKEHNYSRDSVKNHAGTLNKAFRPGGIALRVEATADKVILHKTGKSTKTD